MSTSGSALPGEVDSRNLVLAVGLTIVAAAVAFRTWATFTGWFYFDDYVLLSQAQGDLTLTYLLQPYHNQFMPGGRLLAWVVEHAGTLNWSLAATLTALLQAAAGASALWMLAGAFGLRLGILAPLTLYLTSTLSLPATLWWAAALNQLPMQIAFFVAVGCWIAHLRGGSRWWLLLTVGAVGVGLLFYVKALLILPVLAFLAVAYYEEGPWTTRLRTVLRRRRAAVAAGLVLGGGYVVYYLRNVREPFETTSGGLFAELAQTMIGTAFGTAVVGGPWRWGLLDHVPNAYADPPGWSQTLAWIVIGLVLLYAFLRRHRTLRAWALLTGYLVMLLVLVAASRATIVGAVAGLEYRYLTDSACVLALSLGLAFMPLRGAVDPSVPRAEPLLAWRAPAGAVAALVSVVALLGVLSSLRYIDLWRSTNESRDFVSNLAEDLAMTGPIDLVDQELPEGPRIAFEADRNRVSTLATLVSSEVSFPDVSTDLAVVDPDGAVRQAVIELGVAAREGPDGECGWLIEAPGGSVPLEGRAFQNDWWVRVGYVASAPSEVEWELGPDTVTTPIRRGLNKVFFRTSAAFERVRLAGLEPGVDVCVTEIEVGQPVAGGPMP